MGITDVFTGPYALLAKWGTIALLVSGFYGYAWVQGDEHGTAKLTNYLAETKTQVIRLTKVRDVITKQIEIRYAAVKAKTEAAQQSIKQEATEYAKTNTGNTLDAEWRRLHDAAAGNMPVPGVPPGVDPASGAPTASDAIITVTGNYAKANRNADRLDTIAAWLAAQKKAK